MRIRFIAERTQGRRRWPRLLIRFRRDERGATAIEFAFVLVPFLMILFAVIEIAMMFWTSQILEESLSQTSRTLLTGQSQARYNGSSAANTTAFKNDICTNAAFPLVDCSKLSVDVRSYASFGSAASGTNSSNPVSGGSLNTSGFSYSQPQAGQIVVVRAVLEYPLFFTQWSQSLANIGAGKRAIVATMAFKTEPFAGAGT